MGKQSTNQQTKPATKQDRRRERREEQQRRATTQRRAALIKRIAIGGVIVAIILTVASYVFVTRVLPGSSPTNSTSTSANTNGQSSLMPIVDNVQCNSTENLTYHVHAHLSIYINGQAVPISQNVGITNACFYWLHTHDTTGVIHIEAPQKTTFTLGNFLHVWKQQFSQLQYPSQLDQSAGWQVYVDGKPYTGNFNTIPLDPHKLITLAYQSPGITPDAVFNWGSL